MALGLFWDIVTGLPWTPNGVGSLEPKEYCILLPGAHYLTINSPNGADSSLNKLLLLLLLLLRDVTRPQSHEAEAEATTHEAEAEAEATTHEAEAEATTHEAEAEAKTHYRDSYYYYRI